MSALDESPIFLKSKAFSTPLNHDHISQAIQRSSDMGATLIFSKMSLTDVGTEAAEELATIGRATPEDESIVERIALRNNRLTTLPMEFALLSRLRYLNLRCNCFTVFPDVLTLLPALDTLDLSHNKIKRLPTEAGQLVCLRVFCLSRNRIAKLPSYIANFHNLEILRIDRNPIEWPPRTVSDYVGDPESKKTVTQWVKNLQNWMRNDASRSKDSEDLMTPTDPDLTTRQICDLLLRPFTADSSPMFSEGSTSSLNAAERPTVPDATSIAHSRSVSVDSIRSLMSSDSLQGFTPSSPLPKSLGQPALHLGILRSYGGEISPARSFDSLLPSPADSSASFGDKIVPNTSNARHVGIGRSQDDLDMVVSVSHATMLSAAPFGHEPDETSGWSDTDLNGSGVNNAQHYHDDISMSQPTSLRQRTQLPTSSPDVQLSMSTEAQHSSSWTTSSMTLERNSYFRRLSKLPTLTALPRPLTHLVDFARSILFALCQVFQTLEHYASYAADERLSAILRKVLGPANTDLLNLIRCLDRFDTMSHRHIPSSPVCRALVESCRDTTTVFNKAVGVLALQLRVIATGDDVQYARWILLELYAATAEISRAWQNVAPQRESIRPYLHAKPINFQVPPATPGMNGSDSLSTSSSTERSQVAELAPIRGTDVTTYNIGRTRTSRRHAGSFSSKDVEIGKSLPSYDDIPMSQGRILSGPATKVPVLRTPKRQVTVPQPTVPTPWSSTSDAGFFGDATRFAHSRYGSQTSFQHQEHLSSALPKSPFGELSSSSRSQVDKEALHAIKQAVDIAPKVWNMIESLLSKILHPEPSVEEKLRTARTVTRRLSEAVRLMEDVEVVADRTVLRDDAHLFLKMVVQLSSVIKTYGERQPVSTSLRSNMVKLTNSTEEFAILLHVSSFSPSIPRPYHNTHNDSVTLPYSEEKYFGSSLSRNRSPLTGTDPQMLSKRRP